MSSSYKLIILTLIGLYIQEGFGAEAVMKALSTTMTGIPVPWPDFTDQASAGRIEITFTAPIDYVNKSIWLISRDTVPFNPWREGSFGVWLWNNEIHARIGGPTSAGILRPGTGNTSLTPGQEHKVTFSWDSRAGGGLAVLVDGVLTMYDYRILEGADPIVGQPVYLGSMDPNRQSYSGHIIAHEFDLPAVFDPCVAPETTTNNVATPQLASCTEPPPPPPPPPTVGNAGKPGFNVSWEAPTQNTDGSELTDLAGFKLYWGKSMTALLNNPVVADLPGPEDRAYRLILPDTEIGEAYWLAMTAYDEDGNESEYSNILTGTLTNTSPSKGNILDINCQPNCTITKVTQGASYSYPDREYEIVNFKETGYQPESYHSNFSEYRIGANSIARNFGTTENSPDKDITGQLRENPPSAGAFAVYVEKIESPVILKD